MSFSLCRSLLCAVLLSGAVSAQTTWNFDQTTTGQPIHYVSPTNVSANALLYESSFAITLVEVKAKVFGITFGPFNITDQIPPEAQSGSGSIGGPSPIVILSQSVVYPDPPAAPSIAADLEMGLNAGGFGYLDATNIVLGTILVDTGIFGTVNAQITSVRIKGSLTIEATQWEDLGFALAGTNGEPLLVGEGSLIAGQPMSLALSSARTNASLSFVVGFSEIDLPFKGGVLVPSPDVLLTGLNTGPTGGITLGAPWPAGIPAGFVLYFQAWISDPAGPKGFAASNAISGTAQ